MTRSAGSSKVCMHCMHCMLFALKCEESVLLIRNGPVVYYDPFRDHALTAPNCVHEFNSTHLLADMRAFADCTGTAFDPELWLLRIDTCR